MDDLRLYQDLPPSLATRLALSVHRRIVGRAPFLSGLSDDALLGILARLKALIYVPGQVIFVEGQPLKAIQFVKKGKVLLIKDLGMVSERPARGIAQYDHFGLEISATSPSGHAATDADVAIQLRSEQISPHSARAETYCDVVSLAKKDLVAIFTQQSTEQQLWSKLSKQRKPIGKRKMSKHQGGGTSFGFSRARSQSNLRAAQTDKGKRAANASLSAVRLGDAVACAPASSSMAPTLAA